MKASRRVRMGAGLTAHRDLVAGALFGIAAIMAFAGQAIPTLILVGGGVAIARR